MEKNSMMDELLKEKDKQIKALQKEKEILRKEGKDARKRGRELEKRLQTIESSAWYRLGLFIKNMKDKLVYIIKYPFVVMHNIIIQRKSGVKEIPVEIGDTLQANSMFEQRELILPDARKKQGKDIFSDFNGKRTTVSVVICIHNAPYEVEECILSLWENYTFPYELILVDDGSDDQTKEYVEKCTEIMGAKLIRHDTAKGYTISANEGLKLSESDYIVLLNSDTIVTFGWIEKMLKCFEANAKVGAASPLSNAASYQSVPEIRDAVTGDWKINQLEEGLTVEMMGQIVENASQHRYPLLPSLNGFCFMISRQLINEIGYLDEETFPRGYGEEVDYCMRATKAGYELRVVDDTYIFHEKSKSFTHSVRRSLGTESKGKLKEKHGTEAYASVGKQMRNGTEMDDIRRDIVSYKKSILSMKILQKKVAFLLTARGGSGGANSVCQEVMGMRKLGVEAFVINSSNYKGEFDNNYPELVQYVRYFDKKSEKSLLEVSQEFDIIIGTIFTTVKLLNSIKNVYPNKNFGYYIQDYEPLFYEQTDPYWQESRDSYTLIDNICMFAKTRWIAERVEKEHGRHVNIVEPSIDTALYNPFVIKEKNIKKPIRISAMIRPKTVRRNPIGTMHVLKMLKEKYAQDLEVSLFGCTDAEIIELGEVAVFEYQNLGILKRWEVAQLLADSHIFLDMSTYQAFGRTGLEAMCLGCVAVIPKEGGADKYAIDERNAIIVDTADDKKVYEKICEIIEDIEKIKVLQRNGLETAKEYNIMHASVSELLVLEKNCCNK